MLPNLAPISIHYGPAPLPHIATRGLALVRCFRKIMANPFYVYKEVSCQGWDKNVTYAAAPFSVSQLNLNSVNLTTVPINLETVEYS